MIYADYQKPWHGLGVPVDGLFTSHDALAKADLDFDVVKKPIYHQVISNDDDGTLGNEFVEVPDFFATVRTDTDGYLGVVGNYYTPFQNRDAFGFLDSLVGKGKDKAIYDTAGALYGGKRIWLLVKLPGNVSVKGDPVEKFLLCANSHDGTTPIYVKFTPVRVVCWNTLSAALGQDGMVVKIRHTKGAAEKMDEAARVLGISTAFYEKVGEVYGEMAGFKITSKLLQKYYKKVVPDPVKKQMKYDEAGNVVDSEDIMANSTRAENTREKLVEIFENSPSIKGSSAEGNLWGAYNSVTEYLQYYKTIPGNGGSDERRFSTVTVDQNSSSQWTRQVAFNAALGILKKN
jgi:phage/plasmid-like protein (TIGR03299 family)